MGRSWGSTCTGTCRATQTTTIALERRNVVLGKTSTGEKLAWNSRLRHPPQEAMARANHANPTRGGASPVGGPESKKSNVRQLTVRPPHPFQCIIMTILAPLINVKTPQPLRSASANIFWGASGSPTGDAPPRVGLAWLARAMASGVPQTTIPSTFAPELAKHDPFGHARAMIEVQVTLLAPVQVLPHAAPGPFLEDPPSRSSVTCQ